MADIVEMGKIRLTRVELDHYIEGAQVVVYGQDLETVDQVQFDGLPAQILYRFSDKVNCITPHHKPGRVPVVAIDDNGDPSNRIFFTYVKPGDVHA